MALLFTILGIGLVLFVHELGHFLTARAAGMRVEVFALGFGPRVWGFKRGDTDYRLALLPLGGYVLVAGESGTGPARRGELMAASPAWRIFFFSGGILMNLAFAFLLLPLLFAVGVPFESPVLGTVQPGSAGWEAGLRAGDRILAVDGRAVHGFRHISTAVALSTGDEPVAMSVERDGAALELAVPTDFDKTLGFRRIGVGPVYELAPMSGGPAERAGLLSSDRIVALGGLPVPDTQAAQAVVEALSLATSPVQVRVLRDGQEMDLQLEPTAPAGVQTAQLGISEQQNRVVQARGALAGHLQADDLILHAGARTVQRPPDLLVAALETGHLPALTILRAGERIELAARPDLAPSQIGELLHMETGPGLRLAVRAGGAADRAGLRDGDAILRVDETAIHDFTELRAAISASVSAAGTSGPAPLRLLILRAGATEPAMLSVLPAPLAVRDLGLGLRVAEETVRSINPITAVRIGVNEAWQTILEVTLTLKRMVSGEISATNLGGIISIGQVTHSFAAQGLIPLLLFLCIISVNLAVLNVLPFPALDGGHILLVLIEMARGKPVSVRARNIFNVVGFGFVIALLIFVTTLDIRRLIG
jgi:regulator of sigma E protease